MTRLLAPDVSCVGVDLRGHGESSTAPEYSMLSMVGDVAAIVEELALGQPASVGHSLGATVAAVCAAAQGARAVVCVDTSLRFGDFAALAQALRTRCGASTRCRRCGRSTERSSSSPGPDRIATRILPVLANPRRSAAKVAPDGPGRGADAPCRDFKRS